MQELWNVIADQYSDEFPELLKLSQIALLIPVTTADCERGFSYQNNIKVKSRARLSSSNVDQLMKVYLNGEHYKSFDYKKALTRWMDKDRRIF